MDSKLRFAGDVNLEIAQIKSLSSAKTIDIKNQVIGLNIYEDIFSPFITGILIIKDSVDLVNALPFTGEELIRIKVSTPTLDFPIDLDFYIYKMVDREHLNDRTITYGLHIISVEAITEINKKISRTFSGKPESIISSIVNSKVGLESTKRLNIDPAASNIKFTSNYWSPVHTIDYICNNSKNKKNYPSYLFYENRNGFNFITLNSLYTQPIYQEFDYSNFTKIIQNDTAYKNINKDYKRITNIRIPISFDYMNDISSGKYASKSISYDFTTKQYKVDAFDYFDEFSKITHLNKFPTISKKLIRRFNSMITNDINHFELHTGFGKSPLDAIDIQKRRSLLLQSKSNTINIIVPGRTDYTVGLKVNVKLYKAEPIKSSDDNDSILDKVNSGNYIISAINHTITRKNHECTLELIKDTYIFDLTQGN